MAPELAQWITPAILILGFLYLDRSIRSVRSDSRADIDNLRVDIKDLRDRVDHQIGDLRNHGDQRFGDLRDHVDHQIGDLRNHGDQQVGGLRDHVDRQIGDLRDRMGRVEATLALLRDFFVRNGRGTAA